MDTFLMLKVNDTEQNYVTYLKSIDFIQTNNDVIESYATLDKKLLLVRSLTNPINNKFVKMFNLKLVFATIHIGHQSIRGGRRYMEHVTKQIFDAFIK